MKNILIATPYLNSGGVEVSLSRFIEEYSKKDVNIDLYLLEKKGPFLEKIPKGINIKTVTFTSDIYSYNKKFRDIKNIKGLKNKLKFLIFRLRLKFYLILNNWEKYYSLFLKHTNEVNKDYDLAIDYHGYGHFITTFVAKKVHAKKKIMWIHDEKTDFLSKVENYIPYFDKIFAVGKTCMNNAIKQMPSIESKIDVFYNMSDYQNIIAKSNEKIDFAFPKDSFNILTIGRLEWQKGYDVALETAKILNDRKINFRWFALGQGSLKEKIENKIKEYNLEDKFILLGIANNPYPYIKQADIFVLTSRHEGYCLSTLEARILNKPIVATDIESNREQIINGKTGYLVPLSADAFANKIEDLINDKDTRDKFSKNLSLENFDFTSEFEKLDKVMND